MKVITMRFVHTFLRVNVQEDKNKPKFDDIDISDLVQEEEEEEVVEPKIVDKKPTKREKLDKKRKIEEYLDEHLPLHVCVITKQIANYRNRNLCLGTEKCLLQHLA